MVGLQKSSNLQIGKFHYSLDDLLHGVLRSNKKKPSAWSKQFKPSDPRATILEVEDRRFIAFFDMDKMDIHKVKIDPVSNKKLKQVTHPLYITVSSVWTNL